MVKKTNKWSMYKAGDTVERLRKICPRCGEGIFMAQHKDRLNCGKCGYTEFSKSEGKPEEKPKEEKQGAKPEEKKEDAGTTSQQQAKPDESKEETKSE